MPKQRASEAARPYEKEGQRLKAARIAAGFVDRPSAAKALRGVSTSLLNNYENGIRFPKPEVLRRLARLYGVDLNYLLCLTEEAEPGLIEVRKSIPKPYRTLRLLPVDWSSDEGGEQMSHGYDLPSWVLDMASVDHSAARLIFAPDEAMGYAVKKGSAVVVDTTRREVESGAIYAIRVGNKTLLRRVDLLANGRIRVRADNESDPTYRAFESDASELTVCGRVVLWIVAP